MKKKEVKILIVDDAKIWGQQLANEFKKRGISYDWVKSGRSAINRILEKRYYDAIIMDIVMPVMSGGEATKKIRKLGFTRPIIGHSSMYVKIPSLEEAKKMGMNRCIAKGESLVPLLQLLCELDVIDSTFFSKKPLSNSLY